MKILFSSLFLLIIGVTTSVAQIKSPKRKKLSIGVQGSYINFSHKEFLTQTFKVGNVLHDIGATNTNLDGYGAQLEFHAFKWLSVYGEYAMFKGRRNMNSLYEIENDLVYTSYTHLSFGVNLRPKILRFKTQYSTDKVENYKFGFYFPIRYSIKSVESELYMTHAKSYLEKSFYYSKITGGANAYSIFGLGGEYYLKDYLKITVELNHEFGDMNIRKYTLGLSYNL